MWGSCWCPDEQILLTQAKSFSGNAIEFARELSEAEGKNPHRPRGCWTELPAEVALAGGGGANISRLHGLCSGPGPGGCCTHWGPSSWTRKEVLSPKKEFQKIPENSKVHSKVMLFSERKVPNSRTIIQTWRCCNSGAGCAGGRGG